MILSTWIALLGTAHAATRSYRIEFAPSPSSAAVGHTLHIGFAPGSYSVGPLDIGNLPVSGGTMVYTLEASHSNDLFVALKAYDASGQTSVFSNEIRVEAEELPVPHPEPSPDPSPDPSPAPGPGPSGDSLLFFDNFNDDASGSDPAGWFDTGAGNALGESPALFEARSAPGGGMALRTSSTGTNVHSHFVGGDSESWYDYEYFGRMRMEDATAGIGVTVLSDYPNSDRYLRIRSWAEGSSFRFSPHGASSGETCVGETGTGVVPRANTWYKFRFRTYDEAGGTRVLAAVWDESQPAPTEWQVDCLWTAWTDPTGRPGVWSRGPGAKMWDDLGAYLVTGADSPGGAIVQPSSGLYSEDFEAAALESDPSGWLDTSRNYAFDVDPTLFEVAGAPGGGRALVTRSSSNNIHSHYLGSQGEPLAWTNYVYSGRMLATEDSGGLGVTLYSNYPLEDQYIRFRYWPGQSEFRISNRAIDNGSCLGTKGTGVDRIPGRWYAFKVRASDEGSDVRIQAKVWLDGESEPGSWQVDCVMADPGAFIDGGAPGLWSMGGGEKYWDDLRIEALEDTTP